MELSSAQWDHTVLWGVCVCVCVCGGEEGEEGRGREGEGGRQGRDKTITYFRSKQINTYTETRNGRNERKKERQY